MTNLLQQVGLVPIKTGFLSLVLVWTTAEDTDAWKACTSTTVQQ